MRKKRDTLEDLEPVDLTNQAEVADETAEALAMHGPADEPEEATPTMVDLCAECAGGKDRQPLVRFRDDLPPPAGPKEAWNLRDGSGALVCITTQSNVWSWCHRTGYFTGKMRVRWDRRTKPREGNELTPGPTTWTRKPEVRPDSNKPPKGTQ